MVGHRRLVAEDDPAVKDDVPPNGRWGGYFAKPTKQWFREIVAVERLVQGGTADPKGEGRE